MYGTIQRLLGSRLQLNFVLYCTVLVPHKLSTTEKLVYSIYSSWGRYTAAEVDIGTCEGINVGYSKPWNDSMMVTRNRMALRKLLWTLSSLSWRSSRYILSTTSRPWVIAEACDGKPNFLYVLSESPSKSMTNFATATLLEKDASGKKIWHQR